MSKHTPGKWESVGAAICVGEIDIARVYQPNGMDTPQFYANARLIADAPELLELLVESQRSIGGDWRQRRDAAIAKAMDD